MTIRSNKEILVGSVPRITPSVGDPPPSSCRDSSHGRFGRRYDEAVQGGARPATEQVARDLKDFLPLTAGPADGWRLPALRPGCLGWAFRSPEREPPVVQPFRTAPSRP